MAIELKDITLKWMYISIKELKESGFWTKDFEDNPQTYSDEWINKAINLSSVKINDWTGGYIGYADNIDNLTEEQQIGVKWATAIYTLHWLSKGSEYLLQATTFSQGSQSYSIQQPDDMQFVPDEVQKILINAGLYENIRFGNLKEKNRSLFGNGWRFEFDEGAGYAQYDWVRNNYIANNNITSSDNSILINFINRVDAMPQKLDLKINSEKIIPFDGIKDSDLNKDYIEKVDGKYIVKTSQDINLKQDKLVSGENIKTINGNSLLGSGDISINVGNDWEEVNTSDFVVGQTGYNIPNFDKENYIYRIWASGKDSKGDLKSQGMLQTRRSFTQTIGVIYDQIGVNNACLALSINSDGLINIGVNNPATFRPLEFVFIERKKVSSSKYNNSELMADEPHSTYKRDMDTDLPKETSYSDDIVIRKINSAKTINELNLLEINPIWRIISNNRNDIKELFNKKWLELNKNEY